MGQQMYENHAHGTIAKLCLSDASAANLSQWCFENDVPCIDERKLHCTVLFSKKPVSHLTRLNDARLMVPAKIIGWKKLGPALTLELYAPKATRLHKWMIEQGGTHEYPDFIAHTTVTYDWPVDTTPQRFPEMVLEFTKLAVQGIDPEFSPNTSS